MPLGASFFEDVPLMEFIYLVFTRTPGRVTLGDSGLCCCVPCLPSAIISLCLLIQNSMRMKYHETRRQPSQRSVFIWIGMHV